MHRIAVVEDDETLRKGFVSAIRQHPILDVVFSASNLGDSLRWFEHNSCDVVLVDLGLPDGSGLQLIEYCRNKYTHTEILVVSVFGDEKNVVTAVESGATGYLLKDENNEGICDAILDLLAGGSPISPAIARVILQRIEIEAEAESSTAKSPEKTEDSNRKGLNRRESDVLGCLVVGMTYQETAENLNIKIDTVRTYIKSIYRKLEVNSRGQAVYAAHQFGIAEGHNQP